MANFHLGVIQGCIKHLSYASGRHSEITSMMYTFRNQIMGDQVRIAKALYKVCAVPVRHVQSTREAHPKYPLGTP